MEQLKAVALCRADTQKELDLQKEKLQLYAETNGYSVIRTIMEFGALDDMTWSVLRIMARYKEYDSLLITSLDVLNTLPENITEEIRYLSQNSVFVVSIKDGDISVDNLPDLFRKRLKIIKCKK